MTTPGMARAFKIPAASRMSFPTPLAALLQLSSPSVLSSATGSIGAGPKPTYWGVRREEEKHKSAAERNETARDDERPSPPVPEHGGGDERSSDVPDGGVRVPYAHDEAAPPAAEPVADDGDDGGPAGGLEQAGDHLGGDVEG